MTDVRMYWFKANGFTVVSNARFTIPIYEQSHFYLHMYICTYHV